MKGTRFSTKLTAISKTAGYNIYAWFTHGEHKAEEKIFFATGKGLPPVGAEGFGKGCLYWDMSTATSLEADLYVNNGDDTSSACAKLGLAGTALTYTAGGGLLLNGATEFEVDLAGTELEIDGSDKLSVNSSNMADTVAGELIGGDGIDITGKTFKVDLTGTILEIDGSGKLKVKVKANAGLEETASGIGLQDGTAANDVMKWDGSKWVVGAIPLGATSFVGLTDTPANYSGQSGKVCSVKSTEDGIEFVDQSGGNVADDSCFVGITPSQAPAVSTVALIFFNDETSPYNDTNNNFNAGAHKYTVPVSGKYLVNPTMVIDARQCSYSFRLFRNGSQYGKAYDIDENPSTTGSGYRTHTFNWLFDFSAGDVITMRVYATKSGGTDPRIRDTSSLTIIRLS